MRWFALLLVAACSSPPPPPASSHGGDDIPIVDSHVHLAFDPVADQLAVHGVKAVVDLAAPERMLGAKYPIRVIQSGPMLTHPDGYPLDAWGADGYGIGCDTSECVDQTIARLKGEGAGLIKIAMDDDGLAKPLVAQAIKDAHARGLKVAVHALTNEGAWTAGSLGADVLAHTPLEPISEQTVAAWARPGGRAVISTLAAFGGSDTVIDNLRKLRAAGLTVLYGTDLGNLRVDGPSDEEMALMRKAGMTDDEVRASMTTVPWHFWGFDAIERR
jgi:hypothetical protein